MIETVRKREKRIFGLDLLRVISIMLVLTSHTSVIYPQDPTFLNKLIDLCGFFGVEIFFVMSGFLIGGIIFKQFTSDGYGLKSTLRFIYRRVLRILPNYYLIILVNLLIWMLFDFPLNEVWKYFFFLQNFASPLLPFFPESWSLPIKEFGYVIALILLYVSAKLMRTASRKTIFLCVIIGMTIFFFATKIYYNAHTLNRTMLQWDIALRSVVIYRIDTVLFGVLFGYLATEHKKFWHKQRINLALVGTFILMSLVFCLGFLRLKITDSPFFWNVLCLPMCGLGLVCFLPLFSDWKSAPKRWAKLVEFISEISYCVYLLHYSIVLFLLKHYIDTTGFSYLQLHLVTLAYLTITFVLAYFMYTYFEKPMMQLRNFKF